MGIIENWTRTRRVAVVGATAMLLAGGLVFQQADASWDPNPFGADVLEQEELCSPDDLPESDDQIQGDIPRADQESGRARLGYNCGLSLVGHTLIERPTGDGDTTQTGNANMAWIGDCAYVSGPAVLFGPNPSEAEADPSWGTAVIDVSDPTEPAVDRFLRSPGSLAASEAIHAVEVGNLGVLVVSEYGNVAKSDVPVDVYVFNKQRCTEIGEPYTFHWPDNSHNVTITPNGRYVFATQPLQVLDIGPLLHQNPGKRGEPVFVGNLEDDLPVPLVPVGPGADLDDPIPSPIRDLRTDGEASSLSHEAWPNEDGTKLYIGGVTPAHEALTIVDLTDWLQGGDPHVISQTSGRGHSIRPATIGDRRFLIHAEEAVFGTAYGCTPETLNPFAGPAQPYMTEITDEADPVTINQFGLEINEPENCPAQLDSGINSSIHYHTVDSETDTRFVMASMWHSGIRIFDVRNPEAPTEIAYFNPADVSSVDGEVLIDQAWGHPRYVPEKNQIWYASAAGGFWVLELGPEVLDHLGEDPDTDRTEPFNPLGFPGTTGAARVDPGLRADVTPYYCTLGSAGVG